MGTAKFGVPQKRRRTVESGMKYTLRSFPTRVGICGRPAQDDKYSESALGKPRCEAKPLAKEKDSELHRVHRGRKTEFTEKLKIWRCRSVATANCGAPQKIIRLTFTRVPSKQPYLRFAVAGGAQEKNLYAT